MIESAEIFFDLYFDPHSRDLPLLITLLGSRHVFIVVMANSRNKTKFLVVELYRALSFRLGPEILKLSCTELTKSTS